MTGTPGVVIALAGGGGAFLGASLAEIVRWVRESKAEKRKNKRDDKLRAEDREDRLRVENIDAYREILSLLTASESALDDISWRFTRPLVEITRRESPRNSIERLLKAVEAFDATRSSYGLGKAVTLARLSSNDYLVYILQVFYTCTTCLPHEALLYLDLLNLDQAVWTVDAVRIEAIGGSQELVIKQIDASLTEFLEKHAATTRRLTEILAYLIDYTRFVIGVGSNPGPVNFKTDRESRFADTVPYPHETLAK